MNRFESESGSSNVDIVQRSGPPVQVEGSQSDGNLLGISTNHDARPDYGSGNSYEDLDLSNPGSSSITPGYHVAKNCPDVLANPDFDKFFELSECYQETPENSLIQDVGQHESSAQSADQSPLDLIPPTVSERYTESGYQLDSIGLASNPVNGSQFNAKLGPHFTENQAAGFRSPNFSSARPQIRLFGASSLSPVGWVQSSYLSNEVPEVVKTLERSTWPNFSETTLLDSEHTDQISIMDLALEIWLQSKRQRNKGQFTATIAEVGLLASSFSFDLTSAIGWLQAKGLELQFEKPYLQENAQCYASVNRKAPATDEVSSAMLYSNHIKCVIQSIKKAEQSIHRIDSRSEATTNKSGIPCVICKSRFSQAGSWKKHFKGCCSPEYWQCLHDGCFAVSRFHYKIKVHMYDEHPDEYDEDGSDKYWERLMSFAKLDIETQHWNCRFKDCSCEGPFKVYDEYRDHVVKVLRNNPDSEWTEGPFCSGRRIRHNEKRRKMPNCKDKSFFDINYSEDGDSEDDSTSGDGPPPAPHKHASRGAKRRRLEGESKDKSSNSSKNGKKNQSRASGATEAAETSGLNCVADGVLCGPAQNHFAGDMPEGELITENLCNASQQADIYFIGVSGWIDEQELDLYTANVALFDELESVSEASSDDYPAVCAEEEHIPPSDHKSDSTIAKEPHKPHQDLEAGRDARSNIERESWVPNDSWSPPGVNFAQLSLKFLSKKRVSKLFQKHSSSVISDESGMFPTPKIAFKLIFSARDGLASHRMNKKTNFFINKLARSMTYPSPPSKDSTRTSRGVSSAGSSRQNVAQQLLRANIAVVGRRVVCERWLCSVMSWAQRPGSCY